jgi:hypothetical protein
MSYRLLVSGERASFTTLEFDSVKKDLRVTGNYPAPFNASWIEKCSTTGNTDRLIGVSEGEEAGLLFTFEIENAGQTCKFTGEQPTLGAPAHCTSVIGPQSSFC